MAGDCGSCTLCCKVLGIAELDKPMGQWCPECKIGSGCKIYEARPNSCQIYHCVWLQTQDDGTKALPLSLKPDRCKVVLTTPERDPGMLVAHCDPGYPKAYLDGEIGRALVKLSSGPNKIRVVVNDGRGRYFVYQNGVPREAQMSAMNEDGVQEFVGWKA